MSPALAFAEVRVFHDSIVVAPLKLQMAGRILASGARLPRLHVVAPLKPVLATRYSSIGRHVFHGSTSWPH